VRDDPQPGLSAVIMTALTPYASAASCVEAFRNRNPGTTAERTVVKPVSSSNRNISPSRRAPSHRGADFAAWAAFPEAFWDPIWYFRWLHLPVFSAGVTTVLAGVWKTSLAFSAFGLWTRASTAVAFVAGIYLLGLLQCFGKMHHFDFPALILLGILALSRCGDALSLDRVLRARGALARGVAPGEVPPSGEYTWPIRLVWVLTVLVFFAAGVSKLRRSGLAWVFSDNMRYVLLSHHYSHQPPTTWGLHVAQIGWAPRLMGLSTVLFEVGAPLALLGRTLRWIFVPGLLLMQIGILLLTGAFVPYWYLYVFWVPWDRLASLLRTHLPASQTARTAAA
jgi:hypothetical protein